MNPDIQLLVNVWETIKHYIPKKDRVEAAEHFIRVFDEESDLHGIEDEQSGMDTALIAAVKGHYGFDDESDDDYWE